MTTPVLRCSLAAPLFGCTGWVRTKFSYIQFTPQVFFLFSLSLSLSLSLTHSLTLTLLLSDGARARALSLSLSLSLLGELVRSTTLTLYGHVSLGLSSLRKASPRWKPTDRRMCGTHEMLRRVMLIMQCGGSRFHTLPHRHC